MATSLTIPEDLDAQLDALAEAEHVSKNALIPRGARMVPAEPHRQTVREATLAGVLEEDAELMRRLADLG